MTLCWGERGCEGVFARELWETMISANDGRDVGPGCGVRGALWDPACGTATG